MKSTTEFLSDWLPPMLVRAVRTYRPGSIRFRETADSWQEASAASDGYDAPHILDKVLAATLEVKRGEAAFERDGHAFDSDQHPWPVIAALMWAASGAGGRLDVLDYGGALGSSYFQATAFLRSLPDVSWRIVEQPHYVVAGQTHIADGRLQFFESLDACLAAARPNAVLLSSVLQYLPDPEALLQDIRRAAAAVVVIDRTVVNRSESNRLYIQETPSSIYAASYPCHSISVSRLLRALSPDYRLVADFPSLPFPQLASIDSEFKGFILARTADDESGRRRA